MAGSTVTQPAVLVVDDEPVMRRVLQIILSRMGFDVLLAADGTEAVRIYRRHRDGVALVLLDVNMPGPDGPRTLDELRAINDQVNCCFMTGFAGAYTEDELLQRGADQVLLKPFDLDTLTELLRRYALPAGSRPAARLRAA